MEKEPILPYPPDTNSLSHLHQTHITPEIALAKDVVRKSTKDRYSNFTSFFNHAASSNQYRIDIAVIDIGRSPVHPF